MLITGYRGVGKTFLLKKLLNDQKEDIITTYIDLSNIPSKKGRITEEEVLKEILKQINKTILKDENIYSNIKHKILNTLKSFNLKNYDFTEGINILDIPLSEIKDNYSKLSQFTMELPQKIIDSNENLKGYIIVIDEFQLLKYLENPEPFFWLMRSYSQVQFNVNYIFTGSVSRTAEIISMINGIDGAYGGRVVQINIEPFTYDETKRFIEKIGEIQFSEEGFKQFYKCTRGIPIHINTLASILPRKVDTSTISESLELNVDIIALMWLKVWGTLQDIEKEIIIFIVENTNITWTKLNNNFKYSKTTLSKYIDLLSNKGIIEYNQKHEYILSDIMLKTWLSIKYKNEGKYPQ